jgi:hypothetical protein
MRVVGFITQPALIKRILDHLRKPPPIREVVRVPVDDEGPEVQAS